MNRNESFSALTVTHLIVHLAWATLEIISDDVEELQLLISGDAHDVSELKISCENGLLLCEQPTYGINMKLTTERWMQIFIRVPRSWKGEVEASTISAPLSARDLTGTDLTLETVSGDLRTSGMRFLTVSLRSVSGAVNASRLAGDRLTLRSVSGGMSASECTFAAYRINAVSGDTLLSASEPFDRLDATTVSGSVRLSAPMDQADIVLRAISGRVRTGGVSIVEGAPPVCVTSVSGDIEFTCSLHQQANHETEE